MVNRAQEEEEYTRMKSVAREPYSDSACVSWLNTRHLGGCNLHWLSDGLVIERSLVELPARALSSQLGQLSLPSLWGR